MRAFASPAPREFYRLAFVVHCYLHHLSCGVTTEGLEDFHLYKARHLDYPPSRLIEAVSMVLTPLPTSLPIVRSMFLKATSSSYPMVSANVISDVCMN